jgi:hypothetical protein
MGALLERVRSRLFGQPDLQKTDVTDELRNAGTAFAELITGVGKAVADTQRELDATAGHIATEMAKTEVETVQAVVSNYADNGNLKGVKVISGKTSALSIAVPPALSFERVHLEASFVASEFSATSTANVNVNLVGVAVSSRGFGLRGPSIGASVVNANTDTQSEQTQDLSVGTMSMVARIRPKPVTALPKPPLVFKGPTLALSLSGTPFVQNIHLAPADPAVDPPFLEKRSTVVKIELKNNATTPQPIPDKTIALDCGALDWGVTQANGQPLTDPTIGPKTDSSGAFFITVSRTATSETEAKKDYVIRGSLNLVNATLGVSL